MVRNEMMYRPVVDKEVVEFMRKKQKPLDGKLGEIERQANKDGVPIIPHDTVVFFPTCATEGICLSLNS